MTSLKGETVGTVEGMFDDLEDLIAETTRTVKAQGTDFKDLDDLDTLLEESTAIANAKRAQRQGRKLTESQSELLEANELSQAMQIWDEVEVVAHFTQTTCACGHGYRRFNAWYKVLKHKRQDAARLVRCEDHEGLPSSQFTTLEPVGYCHECLSTAGLPQASIDEHPLLTSLGEQLPQSDEQLELELTEAHATSDTLLDELEEDDCDALV